MPGNPLDPALPAMLPPILAGPIVRRLERSAVYIWVATSTSNPITLHIQSGGTLNFTSDTTDTTTVRVGAKLWLSMIKAELSDGATFAPEQVYDYWLTGTGLPNENDGFWAGLAYLGRTKPSFVGLPDSEDAYRIIHTSCRKPHGGGRDGMALIDELIDSGSFPEQNASQRPHLMVLTGDQIYADDVAAPLTPAIRLISREIVGIDETGIFSALPHTDSTRPYGKINGRQQACFAMGLTSDVAHDHLWTLGEFYAMYLLAFSDALWPAEADLPTSDNTALSQIEGAFSDPAVDAGILQAFQETAGATQCSMQNVCAQCVFYESYVPEDQEATAAEIAESQKKYLERLQDLAHQWDEHRTDLIQFKKALPGVRRLLANVPTLMILDDHEVTDDWNLNKQWAETVYGGDASRRVAVNGLLSYVLFQHWGNVPERFEAASGEAEATILAAVGLGAAAPPPGGYPHAADTDAALETTLGLPERSNGNVTFHTEPGSPEIARLRADLAEGIKYHYTIDFPESAFRFIAIDGRTHREFVDGHPHGSRLSWDAVEDMLPEPTTNGIATNIPTIIVIPTPLLSTHLIEHYLQPTVTTFDFGLDPSGEAWIDYEVNWLTFGTTFQKVLRRVADYRRAIVLAGDVHYGFTKRLQYFGPNSGAATGPTGIIAHLTASAARNSELKTMIAHMMGDGLMRLGLTRTRIFFGYGDLSGTALNFSQKKALITPPSAAVPWDEALDIMTGRILRDGLEETVAISQEVADAYDLDNVQHGNQHTWRYELEHIDDEIFPPAGSSLHTNLLRADITTAAGTRAPGVQGSWDDRCDYAATMMKGLRAADLLRIGKVLAGLPQMGLVTMTAVDSAQFEVQQQLFVSVGRIEPETWPEGIPRWFQVTTTVSFAELA